MDAYTHHYDPEARCLIIGIGLSKLDASECRAFNDYVEECWTEAPAQVVLDLSAVTFIDSSGIGALLGVQKRMVDTQEPIILRGTTPNIRAIIELLRLQRVFRVEEA